MWDSYVLMMINVLLFFFIFLYYIIFICAFTIIFLFHMVLLYYYRFMIISLYTNVDIHGIYYITIILLYIFLNNNLDLNPIFVHSNILEIF